MVAKQLREELNAARARAEKAETDLIRAHITIQTLQEDVVPRLEARVAELEADIVGRAEVCCLASKHELAAEVHRLKYDVKQATWTLTQLGIGTNDDPLSKRFTYLEQFIALLIAERDAANARIKLLTEQVNINAEDRDAARTEAAERKRLAGEVVYLYQLREKSPDDDFQRLTFDLSESIAALARHLSTTTETK
jgi:hypothetical protein